MNMKALTILLLALALYGIFVPVVDAQTIIRTLAPGITTITTPETTVTCFDLAPGIIRCD